MKRILQKARITHLTEKRNSYLIIAIGSIAVNILFGIYINTISSNEKIYLVPPVIDKPFWISAKEVSPEYLIGMNLFLSDLLLNVTPSNAAMKHQLFLRYVDSRCYDKFKTELISQEDRLKKEHMTISFQLTDVQVDASKFIAKLLGMCSTQLVNLSYRLNITYEMIYYHLGLLQVKSFEEVKPHA